jgi:hypothetical protein
MYYLIANTLVRDDERYLDEWIDYHSALGVEHFVIYDHKSVVPVVNRWGDKVTVIRRDVPDFDAPLSYNQTLKDFKSVWLATFDMDEFIVLHKHKSIPDLLENYKAYGGLALNWLIYGSSGHLTTPQGLAKDNFLWRTPADYPGNVHVKTIAQMEYCYNIYNVHTCASTKPIVNEDYQSVNGALGDSSRSTCHLNHYITRSLEEYQRKIDLGKKINYVEYANINGFNDVNKNCTIYDDTLKDWHNKSWDKVDGWFNYYDLYLDMINRFDNAIFVELGAYKGASTVCMADRLKGSKKNIKFYSVDAFAPYVQDDGIPIAPSFEEYLRNIELYKEYITPIKGDSHEVYKQFADNSIDFVFIDANHDYIPCKGDIECWYPKVKAGGVIAGHDYSFGSVHRAVDEFFAGKHPIDMKYYESTSCWFVNV